MQQIERYGVIALVFLLVTIVAVSFWGDSKSPGFWSRLTGKSDGKKEQTETVVATNDLVADHVTDVNLPLSAGTAPTTLPPTTDGGLSTGNSRSLAEMPAGGSATIPGLSPVAPNAGNTTGSNPFLPQAGGSSHGVGEITPIQSPVQVSGSEYVVQKGDSLALIAKRKLGAESRWTEIQSANPGLDPKRLAPGMKLQLPASNTIAAKTPSTASFAPTSTPKVVTKAAPSPKKTAVVAAAKSSTGTYTVKKGDLLRSIAKSQLGDENRWKDIVAANPGLDPSKLAIGQKLKMPASTEPRHQASTPIVASAGKPQVK